jgi:small ligand-binding sensory domain FIST
MRLMKWASAISVNDGLDAALSEAATAARSELGEAPHLTCVFATSHHAPALPRVPEILAAHVEGSALIGCSAGAVIGGGREIEDGAAVALSLGVLPGVSIQPFRIEQDDLPDPDSSPRAWHEALGVDPGDEPHFVLLADPFSIRVDQLLEGMDYAYPSSKKIGGLASGTSRPGENSLFLGNRVIQSGAVGVAMSGNVAVDTVVAQGCRPIGKPLRVTACRQNLLLELDGKRPFETLQAIYEGLDEHDQQLARTALHLGVLTDELRTEIGPGDFLIRNIIGIDPSHGVLAVGEQLREGQTVQFHLRDAATSAEDLDKLLRYYTDQHDVSRATGALLFSCQGRGSHLYGRPNHDSDLFQERVGAIPLGGFFCNGEIGPVGNGTYLHGFTSSFGIFRPR